MAERRDLLGDQDDEHAERLRFAYGHLELVLRVLGRCEPDAPRPWLIEQAHTIDAAPVTVEQPPLARSPADGSLYEHTDWTRPTHAERHAARDLLGALAAARTERRAATPQLTRARR